MGEPVLASVAFVTSSQPRVGLAVALREAGFRVEHCRPDELEEVVREADWITVVVQLDEPSAAAVLERVRQLDSEGKKRWWLAAIGRLEQAHAMTLPEKSDVRLFAPPLDAQQLLDWLRQNEPLRALSSAGGVDDELTSGPATLRPSLARSSELSSASMADSLPDASDSDMALADFSALSGLPGVDSIFPTLGRTGERQGATSLSPEIEALLDASVRRLDTSALPHSDRPAKDQSIMVTPDLLDSLDELLLPDATGSRPEPPWSQRGEAASPSVRSAVDSVASTTSAAAPPTVAYSSDVAALLAAVPRETIPGDRQGPPPDILESSPPPTALLASIPEPRPARQGSSPSVEPPPPAAGRALRPTVPPPGRARRATAHRASAHPSVQPTPSQPPITHSPPPDSLAMAPERLAHGPPQSPIPQHAPRWSASEAPVAVAEPVAAPVEPSPAPEPFPETQGDPVAPFARAVRDRLSGCLLLTSLDAERDRRVVLRDGDLVNAVSDVSDEALLFFLAERGDVTREIAAMRAARLPHSGRRAAAALIANGYLGQDDLWPVLRAHAEWVVVRALRDAPARVVVERDTPERVLAEPNVFGGAAGVEVFIEAVRRMLSPADAAQLLRAGARFGPGPRASLLAESALVGDEIELAQRVANVAVEEVLAHSAESAPLLLALVRLEILTLVGEGRAQAGARSGKRAAEPIDPLDVDAVRQRVEARLALVHEADYFQLLGLSGEATPYEIKRAYLELRRNFEPSRLLTAATADLSEQVELIIEVLDEAYDILRDPNRRRRYRNALSAVPMK